MFNTGNAQGKNIQGNGKNIWRGEIERQRERYMDERRERKSLKGEFFGE